MAEKARSPLLRGLNVRVDRPGGYAGLALRVRAARLQLRSVQLEFARQAAEATILRGIRQVMAASNVSRKIIEGTSVTRVEFHGPSAIRIHVASEYFAGGFDVGKAREEGTQDHWVRPVRAKALRWEQQYSPRGPEGRIGGNTRGIRFSRGHKVKGLPKLLTIKRNIGKERPACQRLYNSKMRAWLQKSLN